MAMRFSRIWCVVVLACLALFAREEARSEVAYILGSASGNWNTGDSVWILRATNPNPTVETPLVSLAGPTPALELDLPDNRVYYVSSDGLEILRSTLDGSSTETIVSGLNNIRTLALDLVNRKLYWNHGNPNIIQRSDLDGSAIETVVDNPLGFLHDIAIDGAGGKIYWLSSGVPMRSSLDGSNIEILDTTSPPGSTSGSIALDTAGGYVFWSNSEVGIQRANLDGTNRLLLIHKFVAVAGSAGSISLDLIKGHLYWAGYNNGVLYRSNLDGTEGRRIYHPSGDGYPMAFDAQSGMMYWCNTRDDSSDIVRASPPLTDVFLQSHHFGGGVAVANDWLYFVRHDNFATLVNGSIHRIKLDGSNEQILLSGLAFPGPIVVDPEGGKFYWIDEVDGLFRANHDGTNPELLYGENYLGHIGLDRVNRKLYWGDSRADGFLRANLDGSSVEHIAVPHRPGTFAIHNGLGKIYWTKPAIDGIWRANLDGTNIELIVNEVDAPRPSSIRFDEISNKMYWRQSNSSEFRRANVDGTAVEIIYKTDFAIEQFDLVVERASEVWMDFAHTGFENGTAASPFNTLQEALDATLPGGTIYGLGTSSLTASGETPTISQPVTLEAIGGPIRIGGFVLPHRTGFVAPHQK